MAKGDVPIARLKPYPGAHRRWHRVVRYGEGRYMGFTFACQHGLTAEWKYCDKAMGIPTCLICLKRMPYPSPDPEDYE